MRPSASVWVGYTPEHFFETAEYLTGIKSWAKSEEDTDMGTLFVSSCALGLILAPLITSFLIFLISYSSAHKLIAFLSGNGRIFVAFKKHCVTCNLHGTKARA